MKQDKIELIIVFKKDIDSQNAQIIIDKTGIKHRKGMDSSRGKIYFYDTGPKFILTFDTEQEKERIMAEFEILNEIHEVYTPDWEKSKD